MKVVRHGRLWAVRATFVLLFRCIPARRRLMIRQNSDIDDIAVVGSLVSTSHRNEVAVGIGHP